MFHILAVGEQELGLLRVAIVEVVADRAIVHDDADEPLAIVEGAADNFDFAVGDLLEAVKISFDILVEELPLGAVVDEGDALDRVLGGMGHDAADIGEGIFGDEFFLAGFEVDGFQLAGVAAAAIDEVEDVAGFIEAGRAGGKAIVLVDFKPRFPAAIAIGLEQFAAAIFGHLRAEADLIVFIEVEAGEFGVLLDQAVIAGVDVDEIEIVILGVAIVEADDDFVGRAPTDAFNLGLDFFLFAFVVGGFVERRDVFGFAGIDIDGVDMEVFVAFVVHHVEDVFVVVGPGITGNRAGLFVSDRFGGGGIVEGTDEHVEHAIDGG